MFILSYLLNAENLQSGWTEFEIIYTVLYFLSFDKSIIFLGHLIVVLWSNKKKVFVALIIR